MSLILEALRKSEAERRAGQPVDPFAAPAPVIAAPPARRSNLAWIAAIAIVAVVLLVAALAWAWRGRGADDGGAAAEATSADAPAPRASDSAPATPADTAPSDFPVIDRIAPPAGDPATAATAAAEATQAASTAPAPAPAPTAPTAPTSPTAPTAPPVALPDAGQRPAPATSPSRDPAVPEPPVAMPPATASVPRPTPAPLTPPATLPSPSAVPPGGSGTPQRLSELATAQRERLPALRISMHMWNADPARRFVIIDGHRQVEGDRLGAGVIRAIDPDGMLVDLDGQLVRVPRP